MGPLGSQYVYKISTLLCIFYIYIYFTWQKKNKRMTSGSHKRKKGISLYCHDLGVTIDGIWTGEWID
jgi:hypothetical protein